MSARKYPTFGKTSNLPRLCGQKNTLKERGRRWLKIILKRDRRATLSQIAMDFNVGASTSVNVQTVQGTVTVMRGWSCRTTGVLLTARNKGPPTLPLECWLLETHCLVSFYSCFGWMVLHGNGDNLMNSWTLHVNKGMFKLVKPLWWYGAWQLMWYGN